MKSFVAAVGVFAVVAAAVVSSWGQNVVQFEVDSKVERGSFDFYTKLLHKRVKTPPRLGTFKYINCGDNKTEILNISSLVLGPDPITFPGSLTVAFKGQIKTTVDAPLKAVVVLAKKVGSTWIKIPCIGMIGSCTYDDLCDVLSGAVCPPPLSNNHIPCKCPFTMGNYTLPKSSFAVDAAVFPPGDYHATANLTWGTRPVGCVELYATFD